MIPLAGRTSPARNSLLYLAAVLISQGTPIAALAILSRILPREAFGAYALAQVYGTFAAGVANFGLLLGYERNFFAYRDRRSSAALLYSTVGFVAVSLAAVLILTWVLRVPLARLVVRSAQPDLLFWTACATGVASLKGYYLTYFRNNEEASNYAGWIIGETIIEFIVTVLLVAYTGVGVLGLAYGQALAAASVSILLAVHFVRILPPAYNGRILADTLRLSAPLTPRIFFGILGTQADKYLLGLLSSLGGVGIYSIGQRVAFAAFQYMGAIQNVYAPRVYRQMFRNEDGAGAAIGRDLTAFAYVSVIAPLVLVLGSEEVVAVLTPRPYHGASAVIMILSVYYAFLFFGKVGGAQMIFARKAALTSGLTLVGIVLSVSFGLALIPRWGPQGAAWATTLSGFLYGAIGFAVSQRAYRIGWEGRKLAAIFGWLLCSALALLAAQSLAAPYFVRLTIKFLAAAGFIIIGIRLRLIPSLTAVQLGLGVLRKGVHLVGRTDHGSPPRDLAWSNRAMKHRRKA